MHVINFATKLKSGIKLFHSEIAISIKFLCKLQSGWRNNNKKKSNYIPFKITQYVLKIFHSVASDSNMLGIRLEFETLKSKCILPYIFRISLQSCSFTMLIIVFSFLFIYSQNCAPSLQHFPMQNLAAVISIQISGCGVRGAKIVGGDVRLSSRSTQAFEMYEKSNLK